MKIMIGADFVPTESNYALFSRGDSEALVGPELKRILSEADCRIFNLETPISDHAAPIQKCGPNLLAPAGCICGYVALDVNVLTLANNHIMDHGEQAIWDTCRLLDENGIAYLGIGSDEEQAAKPYIWEYNGKKIGIYACAEHEFSIVGKGKTGANPFDPLESLEHVAQLKAECDYVIVLYHGGKELYRYPSPKLQKICRKLVEKGASLVVCQHSHCVGCKEEYLGGTIVYGQGNFLFDLQDNVFWNSSLLIQIEDDFRISYLPLQKNGNTVRLAQGEKAEEILRQFEHRSEEILDEAFIEQKYAAFAESYLDGYLAALSGLRRNLFVRVLNKLTAKKVMPWILKRIFGKQDLLAIRNYVECEAHSELLLRGIGGRTE